MTRQKESAIFNWETITHFLSRISYDLQSEKSTIKIKELIRLQCFIAIGSYCGLRASDILRLKWSDLLTSNQLDIQELKTKKTRIIDLNEKLIALINSAFIKSGDSKDGYIFKGRKGIKPITIQHMNRSLKNLLSQYDLNESNVTTHSFRKSFGKRVYEMNGKTENALIVLSKIFNHSSISITKRYIGIQQKEITEVYMSL